MTEVFVFLFFGIIVASIILIAVNFIKRIQLTKNLYEKGLIKNTVLVEKQREI